MRRGWAKFELNVDFDGPCLDFLGANDDVAQLYMRGLTLNQPTFCLSIFS